MIKWFGKKDGRPEIWRHLLVFVMLIPVFMSISLADNVCGNAAVSRQEKTEQEDSGSLDIDISTEPTVPTELVTPTKPTTPTEPKEVPFRASVSLSKSGKYARIKWNKLKGAASYRVYRCAEKNGAYKRIAASKKGSSGYTDKSVKRGSYDYYYVTAVMKSGGKRNSQKIKFACPLSAVSGVKLIRYSTSSVKVVWNKSRKAGYYKVYYAAKKSGTYRLAGTTKNTWYRVSNLKNNKRYYFKVKACHAKKASALDSELSKAAAVTMQQYERMTVFAGDSITTGLSSYGVVNQINIGGNKNVVASIGLNTITFRTRREFAGLSALGRIIAYQPYRAYIMLGTNEIEYRSVGDIISGYREIVQELKRSSPGTDIVLLAVPPVTMAKQQRNSGFARIPALNQALNALAVEQGVHYYDACSVLKDAYGCLQSRYSAGDGIHWTVDAYRLFAAQLEKYDKLLD